MSNTLIEAPGSLYAGFDPGHWYKYTQAENNGQEPCVCCAEGIDKPATHIRVTQSRKLIPNDAVDYLIETSGEYIIGYFPICPDCSKDIPSNYITVK